MSDRSVGDFEVETVIVVPNRACIIVDCVGYAYYQWNSADLNTKLVLCHDHAHQHLADRGGFVTRIDP